MVERYYNNELQLMDIHVANIGVSIIKKARSNFDPAFLFSKNF